ncbi:DNA-directed RNA polymerase subunit beta, partial [Candidatus Pacearchaeota archaeon]|nr:DNA-directed RNA polymerase subunit beta [Candidatus Pacearchaeota archaeon]
MANRKVFGTAGSNFPIANLIEPQKASHRWLLDEGISQLLIEISPIEDFTGQNFALYFIDHSFGKPKYTPRLALEKGGTYSAPIRVKSRLLNKQTGENLEQEVFLGDLPLMTDSGTFIINGVERAVVTQLTRSPGIFYTAEADPATGRNLFRAELRPTRGSWLEFETAKNDLISVRIDRKRRIPVTTFLRTIGYGSTERIKSLFEDVAFNPDHPFIKVTLSKDPAENAEEAFLEIYRKMRPGDPPVLENAKALLENLFFNTRRYSLGKVGRYKLNKRLGLSISNDPDHWILSPEDIVAAIKLLIRLNNGEGEVDDIDHLGNRRVRAIGELAQNTLRIGLLQMERVVKERMSLSADMTAVTPVTLINARPVVARLNEFFAGSQLSQFMDQTNPLAELTHKRRLSALGPGGLSRDRAGFEVRDVHFSHYGRICPIETPEGPNIGLIVSLTTYARINRFGLLETPYRKVMRGRVTNNIEYLSADVEDEHVIAQANAKLGRNGRFLAESVLARFRDGFPRVSPRQVEYMDVSPRQLVSVAASLVPFLEHDDANRALMG